MVFHLESKRRGVFMSRTILFMVSDSPEAVEGAKKYWENTDVVLQVYSPEQWKDGLENPNFRQQLGSQVPTLLAGVNGYATPTLTATTSASNVLQFPQPTAQDSKVQKMDDIEAKAIENAINQYRGNLTEAAKALGIGRATLYRKVKQYQIDPSQARRKKTAAQAA